MVLQLREGPMVVRFLRTTGQVTEEMSQEDNRPSQAFL